jgi:hypothetical protein
MACSTYFRSSYVCSTYFQFVFAGILPTFVLRMSALAKSGFYGNMFLLLPFYLLPFYLLLFFFLPFFLLPFYLLPFYLLPF